VIAGFLSLPVLDGCEAQRAAARVLSLRHLWRQRNETGLYHTIGVVTEEDAHSGSEAYCRMAGPSNAILAEHLSDLLQEIRTALECMKQEPVRFHERYGLPGAMIYLSPQRPAIVVGNRPHVDLQHRLLPWGERFEPASENLLSFTLPLALPNQGAGLRTWPAYRDRPFDRAALTSQNASFIGYEVGSMLCHDGLTPHHGVALRADGRQEEIRITIQGFGVRVDGEWLLYW
jgi:hypothetical protein